MADHSKPLAVRVTTVVKSSNDESNNNSVNNRNRQSSSRTSLTEVLLDPRTGAQMKSRERQDTTHTTRPVVGHRRSLSLDMENMDLGGKDDELDEIVGFSPTKRRQIEYKRSANSNRSTPSSRAVLELENAISDCESELHLIVKEYESLSNVLDETIDGRCPGEAKEIEITRERVYSGGKVQSSPKSPRKSVSNDLKLFTRPEPLKMEDGDEMDDAPVMGPSEPVLSPMSLSAFNLISTNQGEEIHPSAM